MKTLNACVVGFEGATNWIHVFAETDDFEYDNLRLFVVGSAENFHRVEGVVRWFKKDGLTLIRDPDGVKFRDAIDRTCPDDPDRGSMWEFVSIEDVPEE